MKQLNITFRRPIWIVLSHLYLDSELRESDYINIAFQILVSPYNFEEVQQINKKEVFPVLFPNLFGAIGSWNNLNEEYLIKRIIESQEKRNRLINTMLTTSYWASHWKLNGKWKRLEKRYNDLTSDTDIKTMGILKLWKEEKGVLKL